MESKDNEFIFPTEENTHIKSILISRDLLVKTKSISIFSIPKYHYDYYLDNTSGRLNSVIVPDRKLVHKKIDTSVPYSTLLYKIDTDILLNINNNVFDIDIYIDTKFSYYFEYCEYLLIKFDTIDDTILSEIAKYINIDSNILIMEDIRLIYRMMNTIMTINYFHKYGNVYSHNIMDSNTPIYENCYNAKKYLHKNYIVSAYIETLYIVVPIDIEASIYIEYVKDFIITDKILSDHNVYESKKVYSLKIDSYVNIKKILITTNTQNYVISSRFEKDINMDIKIIYIMKSFNQMVHKLPSLSTSIISGINYYSARKVGYGESLDREYKLLDYIMKQIFEALQRPIDSSSLIEPGHYHYIETLSDNSYMVLYAMYNTSEYNKYECIKKLHCTRNPFGYKLSPEVRPPTKLEEYYRTKSIVDVILSKYDSVKRPEPVVNPMS